MTCPAPPPGPSRDRARASGTVRPHGIVYGLRPPQWRRSIECAGRAHATQAMQHLGLACKFGDSRVAERPPRHSVPRGGAARRPYGPRNHEAARFRAAIPFIARTTPLTVRG